MLPCLPPLARDTGWPIRVPHLSCATVHPGVSVEPCTCQWVFPLVLLPSPNLLFFISPILVGDSSFIPMAQARNLGVIFDTFLLVHRRSIRKSRGSISTYIPNLVTASTRVEDTLPFPELLQ